MNKFNKAFALPNEVWSPVKGYEGLYEVSSMGKVRSLRRGKILRPGKNTNGYLYVVLWKNGKCKNFLVHRLVAEAFIPNPESKSQINHLSEFEKTNNHYSNLSWTTPKENNNYGTHNERSAKARTNGKRSKPVQAINPDTGEVAMEFPSTKEAGRNGFNHGNVVSCCLGKYKQAYGYIWRYK